ncbi:hypothetical protein WK72_09430 [Burkholderia ubonensis]|nr:hypothetical protein WK72_09430 [Burkholderia ubonensis]KWB60810.1 hypothetical protein WL38_26295 [Burkholderia ubonensis]KWB64213.1 hypothetical protein WL39_14660 [Burkholderia ubonensis]KWH04123.1 hypothetical protein WL97_27635 [Burkholderia ubonensis]OJA80888.1 hypothetical protein BGV72_02860 [Burkholderia ubonensis]
MPCVLGLIRQLANIGDLSTCQHFEHGIFVGIEFLKFSDDVPAVKQKFFISLFLASPKDIRRHGKRP